jgi:hypothetical protein
MIDTLKMKEAKAWVRLQDHEEYCYMVNGQDSNPKDWRDFQISMMNRYSIVWCELKDLLSDLDIKAYTYHERLQLIIEEKL